MSERQTPESGLRLDRIGFLRETVTGEIPVDPDWQYHSDNYLNFEWAPDPGAARRDGLGTPDAVDFHVGTESHSLTVAYDLQQPLVDATGEPLDAAGDAWLRNADNQLYNTHAVLARESRQTRSPDDPTDVQGARTYTVMKGGHPNANLEGDPEEGVPIPKEIEYTAEKIRSYEILQPANATLLVVQSTDSTDTVDVTIEDEDAATTETVTLDGTNLVSTSTQFSDIDAVSLVDEASGDVTVHINDGDATAPAAGSTLTEIKGALHYSEDEQPLEGDLGVPALGAGSHATLINTSYEHFAGDSVQRNAEGVAYDLNNLTAEVDNNYDATPRADSVRPRITEGNRDVSLTTDVIGERESHAYIMQSLTAAGDDIDWGLSRTLITFDQAAVMDPPSRTRESDEAAAAISVGFESEGVTITEA